MTGRATHETAAIQLDAIAGQVRWWLDWHKAHRDQEHLITDRDTSIMSLPVAVWPNHGQFEAWIKCLSDAAYLLRGGYDGTLKSDNREG